MYFEIYNDINESILCLKEAKKKLNKLFIEKSFDNDKKKKEIEEKK